MDGLAVCRIGEAAITAELLHYNEQQYDELREVQWTTTRARPHVFRELFSSGD